MPTNNIPAAYQQTVMQAILQAQELRITMEADGRVMDMEGLVKEVYKQLVAKLQASGADSEEFIPEHHFYLAAGLRRIVNWSLNFAKEYPPTHRKGYGEASYQVISSPNDIIFLFGGGGHGGPPLGPGDPAWPTPEDPPMQDDFFEWVPDDEQSRAQSTLHQMKAELNFGYYDDPHPFIAAVARRLGGRWGRNGKRGNPNDPSEDILAYDFPGFQPQIFDCIIGAREKNEIGWNPLPYPQPYGAVWIPA